MIDEAVGRDGGADALRDHSADLDDPLPVVQSRGDPVTHRDRCRRLGRAPVDLHVSAPDRGAGVGARLREPDGVQPLVDADGVDVRRAYPAGRQGRVPPRGGARRTVDVVTRRNVVWLVAVLAAGVVVGVLAGWLWGVAAAIVTLVVSEVVERTRRARIRRVRGDATRVGVRDVVGSRRRR